MELRFWGENKRKEVTEYSTRKENTTKRENPGDLQINALKLSAVYWSAQVCGNTTQGQRKNHIIKKSNSDWSPHRAKNRTLFLPAVLDNVRIDGTMGNTSRRVLPQDWEIIICGISSAPVLPKNITDSKK